jgi:hypothetical protein
MTKLKELKAAAEAATDAAYDAANFAEAADSDAAEVAAGKAFDAAYATYREELKKQENSDDH